MRRLGGIVGLVAVEAIVVAACALAASAAPHAHAAAHWCGYVRGHGDGRDIRWHVRVASGHVSCKRARHVIRYNVSHGHGSQASVGRSPRGWTCGWGHGIYHHDRQQFARSGPSCARGRRTVEGYAPGYGPAKVALAASG